MKIGYIQSSPVFGEKEKNFNEINNLIQGRSADLLVLPELFATGYAFHSVNEVATLAESKGDVTTQFLKELSQRTNAIIVAGFIEKSGEKFYNSSMMVSFEKVIGIYRKLHLFDREKLWFSPGNRPLDVYNVNGVKIGMMICFDWIFPEVSRILVLKGTQVIAHPANLVMPYCQKAMTTRCLENRVFAVTANRNGEERRGDDHLIFTGCSQITAPNGDILSSASADKNYVDIIDIDISLANNKNVNDHNSVIKDRRPQFYKELVR